jgi:hypothetical protein
MKSTNVLNMILAIVVIVLAACRTSEGHNLKEEIASPPAQIQPEVNGAWTPIVSLKDMTDTFSGSHSIPRPEGGWWVTPIHVNLLTSGKVLVTGWSRPKERSCKDHQGRLNGTSFVLDPSNLDVASPTALEITPLDEQPKIRATPGEPWRSSDVLYCSGHAPFPDGRVLFMGGARYWKLDDVEYPEPFEQKEFGLPYARVFDPKSERFSRIEANNPSDPKPAGDPAWGEEVYGRDGSGNELRKPWYEKGMMWYPTNTLLPNGSIMVNGGLARWVPVGDLKWKYHNRSVTIFNPKAYDEGQNPWLSWVSHSNAPREVAIDVFDYPKVFVLPKPVVTNGLPRHIAIYGGAGWDPDDSSYQPAITLLSLDPNVPESQRFATPANSRRGLPPFW